MDFSALSSELQNIAGRYNGRDTDPAYSTTMYCEMFHKILQKTETEVHDYADQIVILWMTLSQLCNTANTLASCPARNELYQDIFLQCAKTVLNIKWQNLAEDDHSKENFIETVKATHVQLVTTGFDRFSLLLHLMENPWTDPTLSEIMSGEADNEDDAVQEYIRKESTLILKLRVEMLMQENCEEFALNLCNTLMGHDEFVKDMNLRETQLKLLHKLNHMDKLQEVCEKIVCHDGVKLVLRLEQKECNQALSVRLIQLFLVQDWIKPEQKCCTQELLKLWIRHQYIADHNKEKFLDSVWAIAKLSLCTQQILLLVTGLQRECGNEMIQLYTDLCVYAINVDKGCCEQQMLQGNMEGVKDRQHAIAQTCRKLSALYNGLNPKISRISSLTAFSLDASLVNLCLVERMFNRKYCTHSKKECAACIKVFSSVTHCVGDVKVNPATLYEVERLLNMLRPYYLNPDLAWKELLPVCQKFMKERSSSSSLETNEETTPPKTPPKKKSDSKSKTKKSSTKKEMSVSPGNINYYCDDNVSYLPKETVPKMKNKNFRMKLAAASSNSCTQTPKPEDSKAKQHTAKPAAVKSPKASAVFEFDKQLFQYNFKGKSADSSSPSASATVVKEQMSPAGSELSRSFTSNHPKTPPQIANMKCQAVGLDSFGQPMLVKLPLSIASPSTATISSTVGSVVAPTAARQQPMYIGEPTALGLQTPNPNTGLHIAGQGKIQKSKKRQPHSIGELLEATRIMPCSTSSNFNTAASIVTSPRPATKQSLPTSADLLRAARDYNLTIVQKPVTPKPFQTQYSTADLLRATKNIPQKSKPELQSPSSLQSAKDMMQATKAAFAASVLGFIPKPQSAILSEVSQGLGQTSIHNQTSVGSSGSELKPNKKPRAPRKPKTVVPGQTNQKVKVKQVNVSQCNSVQTTSNATLIAHSYKTVDGSISFLSSNVAGASSAIPTLVNQINAQSPVRPPSTSYQTTSDKSNHRPRIIPIRATCNNKFPPYCSSITSDVLSPGQVVGANTTVTTSSGPLTSPEARLEQEIYNQFTKEKPAVKQSPTAAGKIEGFRRPSADELQSIVDWLQTGTEDDKKKMQGHSHVSAHITTATQQVATSVPSPIQSRTPTSVVSTTASSFVMSPTAISPKAVSLTHEQLQKIMAGLGQRHKIKQKPPTTSKAQQKKSLNKQLQELLAQDIKKGSQLVGNKNNFVQQNPSQKSQGNEQMILPSSSHANQPVHSSTTHANQPVHSSSTHGNKPVHSSSTHANQPVHSSSTHVNQPVHSSSTHGNKQVHSSSTGGNQLVHSSTHANQPVHSSSTHGNQPVHSSSTNANKQVHSSSTHGNQPIQPSTPIYPGIQPVQPKTPGIQPVHPTTPGIQPVQQLTPTTTGIQLTQPSTMTTPGIQMIQSSTPTTPGIQLTQPSTMTTPGIQLTQPSTMTTPGIQMIQSSTPTTPGIQMIQSSTPTTLGNQLVQALTTQGIQLVQPSTPTTPGIQLVQPSTPTTPGIQLVQSSTHVNQLVQPTMTQGNQLIQSAIPGIQLVQPSTLGDQLAQAVTFDNQLVQPSITPGIQLVQTSTQGNQLVQSVTFENQLVQSSPTLGIQLPQPPMTDGIQLVQPSTTLGSQLVQSTFAQGIQPVQPSMMNGILAQPTSSYGNQLSFTGNPLVQSTASQGNQAVTHQSLQAIVSLGSQLSLAQGNQAIQSTPTQGNQLIQPLLTTVNQLIQQSQNQEVVSVNPLFQSTTQGLYTGDQQTQPSPVQEVPVSDALLTPGSSKPQLIAPALTLPMNSQVTQSLTSTDQVTNAMQTISTSGIQSSLSFPSQFHLSGSKSLTVTNQSTSRVLELQYLGQINPPSKILHPKPLSKDSPLILSSTASGDTANQPGKTSEHLPEINIKAASEIQGMLKSKQPTFIPKTVSSEDESNIPKMPLGTLKVVEKPDLVSTLFGKNRNPSKLSIDNNHTAAVGGSVEKGLTEKNHHTAGECEPAISSSSDYDEYVHTTHSNASSTQPLPVYDNTVCSVPTTTQVPHHQTDGSAETTTSTSQLQTTTSTSQVQTMVCTSQIRFESANIENSSLGENAIDVPHTMDAHSTCNTSELTISSSSETDKEVIDKGATNINVPVNNFENVLETNLENQSFNKKSDAVALGEIDSPDSTTLTTNIDNDTGDSSTVVSNPHSCDDRDTSVQSQASNAGEKGDGKSKGGQASDLMSLSDVTDSENSATGDKMLPTPNGDDLVGESVTMKEEMKETSAMEPTEGLPEVPEVPSSSDSKSTDRKGDPIKTINTASDSLASGMEESPGLIGKENVKDNENLSEFQKETGSDSNTAELSQSLVKEIREETGSVVYSVSEHIETAAIQENVKPMSTEETIVPANVLIHTTVNVVTPISADEDGKLNDVLRSEQSVTNADREETVKPGEDTSEVVLTLDDSLGAGGNMTPVSTDSVLPNDFKVESAEKSDIDNDKAKSVIKTLPSEDVRFDHELDNLKDAEEKSVESAPLSQETPETGMPSEHTEIGETLEQVQTRKPPEKVETGMPPEQVETGIPLEQKNKDSSDSMKVQEGGTDMETEKTQSLVTNDQNPLNKDSIPNKGWENAFVSFIDNMGEKKMVKTDSNKVNARPVLSRQDSSGSESSSRSVGSSLGSRGSHRSSLDDESSGTRILPLQRRDNDVKRFEFFSYNSSSNRANKKRSSSKGLTGLQIQALPEIKVKSKHTMKLVPSGEVTETPQQKEGLNKCIICSKTFRSVDSLKCHVRNICRPTDGRPDSNLKDFEYRTTYSCHKCEKEVSKKEEIKTHVAECFKGDDVIQSLSFSTRYMCQMCGEYFSSKDDVHSHVSRLCSKVMSCRQQQQERLDKKTEQTAKPLTDMVESWYSKDEKPTDNNTKEEVSEVTHEEGEAKKSLGLDDLELEIFNESNNQSDEDSKEESISKTVVSKKRKHQVSNSSLPLKQWSLRNKTKFSSRLKGFEFFANKLNPARRRTEQRKWHEDYHSLRNRVVKKEAVKQVAEGKEDVQSVEHDGKTYAKHRKFPRVVAKDDSMPKSEPATNDKDNEIRSDEEKDSDIAVTSKAVKLEEKESDNTEIQNHTTAKSKGAQKDAAPDVNNMDPPLRQKRVIQVGRKFLQDEFEVPEFLKMQVANTNLKRKSPQHCPKCGQFFSSTYILIQHVVRVHMSPCKSKWNSSARKVQYPCWYCSDAFPTYVKFAKHVPVHKDKILAMLKKSCTTGRRLRRGPANINNVASKTNKTSVGKTERNVKSEPVSPTNKPIVHSGPSPVQETDAQALSQHVEIMRTSRRARGQPPLNVSETKAETVGKSELKVETVKKSELKLETVKKERSLSREKDPSSVGGLVPSVASPLTLDMRTTRSRRRDNDSMSTSSFDHDDDLASNCSHATDKSSQSRGKRDYNKRGLSEDRESMTSEDSVSHRPVTRHQGAAHISPPLQDSHGTAKKQKLGHNAESELGGRLRTRSGKLLFTTASIKCNDVDKSLSVKHQAETKPTGKAGAVSTSKVCPTKSPGSLHTCNQSKVGSDPSRKLSDCVSQIRHVRREAKTDNNVQEKESSKCPDDAAEDDGNSASNMTTRRSRRLNHSLSNEKEVKKNHDNSNKRSTVDALDQPPVTRHKNNSKSSTINRSGASKGKTDPKSEIAEKVTEPRKRKFPAKEKEDGSSKKCVKNEIEVSKNQSLNVDTADQKSVLIVSEEDEEFVYVKSPLSSPNMSPRGITPVVKKETLNSKPLDGKVDKSAFIESFKKYIHKPASRWNTAFPPSKKITVTKSRLKQKVCRAQARLIQKRWRTKMESSGFSSEDEADDELDEDVHDSNVSEKNNEKKSFLDSFIAHCDRRPRRKGFYSTKPVGVSKEDKTEDSTPEILSKGEKTVDGKMKPQGHAPQGQVSKGQTSKGHQAKKEMIAETQRTDTESKATQHARQSKSECVKGKTDEPPAEPKDKELDLDCSEEVKTITESKECRPCVSAEQGNKLDPSIVRPTSFESLQTYIDSMSNSASPTPSVDSTNSKDTHSKKSLKISKSMASTFQDSFMTYLGSKPKKSRKTSDGSCSSSECGDVKSCSSSVCDGDTGVSQKSRGQKSHTSKPFTWDVDSGDERIDLLVSRLGRVVTDTSETGGKPDVTQEGTGLEEAPSETSVSARSSVERILPNKHGHPKAKVRRIYHDGKIWEIGHGSVKSVSVVQSDIVTTDKVHGRDSPVSDVSDCGDSNISINSKSDSINISRPEHSKGDNRIGPLKSEHHHLSKSSKAEQNVQANVEMIRVDRKHDGGGFVRLDKSEVDQYDKMNTYTSVTPEDMANKKTENVKKSAKWKVKTEKRTKSSNMKDFPFVFKKNRRM